MDVHAHDWTNDEFARGTWSMYRPGQLSRYLARPAAARGPCASFPASDVASGWNGFIDGAIESGMVNTRKVASLLR